MMSLSIDSFFRNETKHKIKKANKKDIYSHKEFKNMFTNFTRNWILITEMTT